MAYLDDRLGVAGKVALIVGGAGGLGRACAVELGRAGMRLAIGDRDAQRLATTAASLAREGVAVHTEVLDSRDPEALGALHESVSDAYDRLDVLVNVVGGTYRQPFEQTNPRGWDALIRTNYTWLLASMQLAIAPMRAVGGGSIINLGSIEGHRAAPNFAVYAGLKAAVANVSRSLAVELAPDRIRVNTIAPDYVPTEGLAGARAPSEPAVAAVAHRISVPMGRWGDEEDVGGYALFLASDLSRFVTGTTLHPDGGTWASAGWFNWPGDGWRNTVPDAAVEPFLDDGDDQDGQ